MKFQIEAMLAGDGGAILNMASVSGSRATTNLSAYVAGKAGIIALAQTAALDYADRRCRINVVAPGPILTHHLERAGQEAQRLAAGSVPMGRVGASIGGGRCRALALLPAVVLRHRCGRPHRRRAAGQEEASRRRFIGRAKG